MSAAKPARTRRKATRKPAAAETIPLSAVSITIAKPKLFSNDEETVTFDGDRLAAALRYIALACPNLDFFTDASYAAIELAGVAEICKGLGDTSEELDTPAAFHALYRRLDDLAARINAKNDVDGPPKLQTLTITRKPAAVASSSADPDAARKIAAYDAAQKIVDAVKKAGKGKVAS